MFYGLNKFLKKVLPKRLFYRSLIIVAAPIIILQFKGDKEWDFFGEVNDWKTDAPVNKIMLKQGDLLFFPKWAPHVAKTIPGVETGHATIELPSEFSKDAIYPKKWMDLKEAGQLERQAQ